MKQRIAMIKPRHPIWDEVWNRLRPREGGRSILEQLFEAKLQLTDLNAENTRLRERVRALREQLEAVLNRFPESRIVEELKPDKGYGYRAYHAIMSDAELVAARAALAGETTASPLRQAIADACREAGYDQAGETAERFWKRIDAALAAD